MRRPPEPPKIPSTPSAEKIDEKISNDGVKKEAGGRPPISRTTSLKAFLPELQNRDSEGSLTVIADDKIIIRVEVIDSGPGVKPSDGQRLFSPFFQTRLGTMQAGELAPRACLR